MAFDVANGKGAVSVAPNPVIDGPMAYVVTKDGVAGYFFSCLAWPERDSKVNAVGFVNGVASPAIAKPTIVIKAGKRLYAGGENFVAAMDLPFLPENPDAAWRVEIEGPVVSLLAGGDSLVAVCEDAQIYCLADAKLGAA